jgi:hypothetical protein
MILNLNEEAFVTFPEVQRQRTSCCVETTEEKNENGASLQSPTIILLTSPSPYNTVEIQYSGFDLNDIELFEF